MLSKNGKNYYLVKGDKNNKSHINDKNKIIDRITRIQRITKPFISQGNKYYQWGQYLWKDQLIDQLNSGIIPDNRFIELLSSAYPPPHTPKPFQLKPIVLNHNNLMMMEAIWASGSQKSYRLNNHYYFTEHAGGLEIDECKIKKIFLHTDPGILDSEQKIILPGNKGENENVPYVFHTHPYDPERLEDGIIYEFPSANDIFHFMYLHNIRRTMGSIILAPEGVYIIRAIYVERNFILDLNLHYKIERFLEKVQDQAYQKYKDEKKFYEVVINDYSFINKINKKIADHNVVIEYHARTKINNEWRYREIVLWCPARGIS
jgi:hypothetical protein